MPNFRSFQAASRKHNMKAFGLFKTLYGLGWIEDNSGFGPTHRGVPTGTKDGVNDTFTIPLSNPQAIMLLRNGLVMKEGVGFNVVGNTVVFEPGYIPLAGTELYYFIWGEGGTVANLPGPPQEAIPTGTIDGVNDTFTIPVSNPRSIVVVVNGMVMKPVEAYQVSGTDLVFESGYEPPTGATLYVYFWE